MKWINDVLLDLIVTISILIGVIFNIQWLIYIIIGYTILMLIAKSLVLFGGSFLQLMKKTSTNAPLWFSHLLYAANVVALLVTGHYYTGGMWILIWLFSYITHLKTHKETVAKKK